MTGAIVGVPRARSGGVAAAQEGPGSSDDDDMPGTERDSIDVVAFRNGDDKCFRAVLGRFEPLIRKVVWSYADSFDDREDLYQEVCIRILEQRARYREQGSMGGWISTVARHAARNWHASRSAREFGKDRYAIEIAPIEAAGHITADPSRLLDYRECLANLERALDAIPEQQGNAFRLVQIEGYSAREAARILDSEPATVRSNLRHARKKLREQLVELTDEVS